MPTIYSGPCERLQFIQFPAGSAFAAPWVLLIGFDTEQPSDVRFRGSAFWYRDQSVLGVALPFAYANLRCHSDRSAFILSPALKATDIIRLVPFYDFDNVLISVQPSAFA